MPYCVNCGVELNQSAKRCPLCGVRVVLPPSLRSNAARVPRPQQHDIAEGTFNKSLWIQVVSVLMAIPALICIVINAAFGEGLTWSLYVVAGLGTVWIWCISPFLHRRNIVQLWITTDAIALVGLLYVIDALSPSPGWFTPLALPIALTHSVFTLLIVTLARSRILRELHIVAATLLALCVLCVVVESVVDLYLTQALRLQWSLLVVVLCAPLAIVAVLLQRRTAFVEDMKIWLRM
ncbi:MAG: DUF6320 domain-containing protein [Anaerolineae bacterium]|nr:DUF6320 domain-containing protein [Anaerolineae bacterium]